MVILPFAASTRKRIITSERDTVSPSRASEPKTSM